MTIEPIKTLSIFFGRGLNKTNQWKENASEK
jgi:hypothetical protein